MADFFRAGGFGMYPTLVFGFLLIASSVLYVLRGERRYVGLMFALGTTTLAAGLLGTCTGLVSVSRYLTHAPEADRVAVLAGGVAEALHDVVLALGLLVIAGVIASIGAFRARPATA